MTPEAIELGKIRARLDALGPRPQWGLAASGDTMFVEMAGRNGDRVEIFRFHRGASSEEIDFAANAPAMVDFLLRLVDRAIVKLRAQALQSPAREVKNFAAEASIKCGEPAFMAFLEARHGLTRPLTKERAAERLRSLLGISSRKELNNDLAAADRWRSLRADFDAWRKAG